MSWIIDDWRLKLLALVLAVAMLGAVAFSQNPPTFKPLSITLNYRLPPNPGIIITKGPSKINVTATGLADAIASVSSNNVTAFADATHASPGKAVPLGITVNAPNGIGIPQPNPVAVDIDQLKTVEVPVTVNAHPASGWTINQDKTYATCPPNPNPCRVHFSGPASWENGIQATVNYGPAVNLNSIDSPNAPITLTNSSGTINLSQQTYPSLSLDFYNVGIHIEAQQGSSSKSVVLLVSNPAQPPPPQFQLVGVSVNPALITISGDAAVIGNIQNITLPAIDLSSVRSTYKVSISIPYPDNVTGTVQTATITFFIKPVPSPSPSP